MSRGFDEKGRFGASSTTTIDDPEALLKPLDKLIPEDLLDFEAGDAKGEPVAFRINPRYLSAMDRIIQLGRETPSMPKTRSEFARLCVVRHLKKLMKAGLPQDWDDHPVLATLKAEFEIGRRADYLRERLDLLRQAKDKIRSVVSEHLMEQEYDLAADALNSYFAVVSAWVKKDAALAERYLRSIRQDEKLMHFVELCTNQGYEVSVPHQEEV